MSYNVAILAFDDLEELDLGGPWEVLQSARELNNSFDCKIYTPDGNDLTASKGMKIGAHGCIENVEHCDILIVPGGKGVWPLQTDSNFLQHVTRLANTATWVCSVCTGSFLLASAGLLNGKSCTTYHAYTEKLRKTSLIGEVLDQVRYVVDGNVLTAAGVSAGIDMSLWLVKKLEGEAFAKNVQRYMEYYPEPPLDEHVLGSDNGLYSADVNV
ncbi:DJ-1/PfpI family protein [Gilvimarinus sp. SDUM040013]|uniref:DJ-1/PfpI family protein n=1 Tax=Gilvimarinus gilvus TaxID=3058038 RepID=A0ABU4S1F0_9GAMM|nr:DJ-1/PfpI family protein [Gilvimarinus sp. SDUM040013]MDO3384640.1 DJ-1/PfpI family protein [Gilvimarinus sp. SDUM040013]MDX6850226.1 DJ-1/PfpI family protein [Gilvimarinus sp. SDUM040013]